MPLKSEDLPAQLFNRTSVGEWAMRFRFAQRFDLKQFDEVGINDLAIGGKRKWNCK